MPHKKPKKKELTTIQKKENQILASKRVKTVRRCDRASFCSSKNTKNY